MIRAKYAAPAVLLVALAACTGDATSPVAPDGDPSLAIVDAAHSAAAPGFYFLPPTVKGAAPSGTFDAALQPRVEICELAGSVCGATVATFPFGSGSASVRVDAGAEHYIANWHTSKSLNPAKFYRIQVFVGAFRLGYADADVVAGGKDKHSVDETQFVAVKAGQTTPIKFRIETGIAAQVVVSPASATINVGATQQFTATVTDLHGAPLPSAAVAWTSSNATVATVDGNGLATGAGAGTATITATSGASSGSATLTVLNPNTPPVAVADTFQAIGNVTVPVAAPGVLANDTDAEGNSLTAVAGTYPTTGGGTVTLNADGGFSYLSAPGFTGEDTFQYTVTDGQATSTAVAAVRSAYRVWYVDNSAGVAGDGRDAAPFTTLKAAESASAAGETVFVRAGNGGASGYDEGFILKAGQSLTGQGITSPIQVALNGATVTLLAPAGTPNVARASAGTGIQLATDNTVQGIRVATSDGAGIAGDGFGTFTAAELSVDATGGAALDLENGIAAAAFGTVSSAGSGENGLRLVNVGGTLSATGGLLTGAAGVAVLVQGGDGIATYAGDVVSTVRTARVEGRTGGVLTLSGSLNDTGAGILVQNNVAGTIAFTGASKVISTGASAGVTLADNGAAIIQFAGGGLAITTTSGDGFRATDGGVVTVTGAGNAILTSAGTALRVVDAATGAAGLSFRSIAAAGGVNGILLRNTDGANTLQVTGTGSAGSGGTIQSTSGDGVRMENVSGVSLASVIIRDNLGSGIAGENVSGFALAGSTVLNNGDNAAADEAGIQFQNLLGASSITESVIGGSVEDNLRIVNTAGVLNRLTLTSVTVNANSAVTGGDGVSILGSGPAVVNVTVQNSQFTGARVNLLRVALSGSASGNVVLGSNTFGNTHPAIVPGAGGVALETGGGAAALTYDISGNTFRDALGSALSVQEGLGTGTVAGLIRGNTVGVAGVANSGSLQGSGISLTSVGGGSHTVSVTGNQVRQYNNQGVLLQIGDASAGGNGTLNATVTSNVIAQPGTAPTAKNGIHLNAGLATGDNPQVCVDLGGAGSLANSVAGSGSGGAAGTDLRLRQRFLTTVRLPGYAGGNADNAAVVAFEQARNGGAPTGLAQNAVATGGGGFVGGAGCPQP